MNDTVLTIEDAARCLPELVERVHTSGKAASLTKAGRTLARIVAVPNGERNADDLIAFLRNWQLLYPEPDEQFAAAIESSRTAIQPPHDPWE